MNIYTVNQNLGVPILELTTLEYNTILAGIVYGFIDKQGCTEIETCIGDGKDEATLAFDAFKKMWSDVPAGIIELTKVITALPGMMTDCKNIQDDVATLTDWGMNLATQTDLENYIRHNVQRHIIALTADLAHAKAEYAAGEYFAFGETLGEMAVIATL